jgi:spartin
MTFECSHKYGAEAGEATRILGGSVRNVALVYVDVRGVGRKTLFKSTAKGFKGVVKTRLADGKEVTITGQDENGNLKIADGDHAAAEVTVGMQNVGLQEKPSVPTHGSVPDPRKMKKML